jgi:hypothetical protein
MHPYCNRRFHAFSFVGNMDPEITPPVANLFGFPNVARVGTILAMTPLLSGSLQESRRNRRNHSVKYHGKIPSISRQMVSSIPRLNWPVRVVFALCLAAASIVHINDLWQHGWLPYRFAPLPLNFYWTMLAFLDAIAALLLLARPGAGLALALLVIVSDVGLNLFARLWLGLHLRTVALSLQVLFLIAVVAATLYARRVTGASQTI